MLYFFGTKERFKKTFFPFVNSFVDGFFVEKCHLNILNNILHQSLGNRGALRDVLRDAAGFSNFYLHTVCTVDLDVLHTIWVSSANHVKFKIPAALWKFSKQYMR